MRASIGDAGPPEDLLDVRVLPERVHQGIELGAIDGGGEQRRRDLEILIAEGGDVEFAQGVVGLLQHLLEPGQYLLLVSAADESGHVIGHFGVHVVHRVTVYLVDQGTQQGVGGQCNVWK